MAIDRCICSNIRFDEILEIANEKGFETVKELQEHKICANNCKLCVRYIEEMLKTGQVSFRVVM